MSKIDEYVDHVGPGWRELLFQAHLCVDLADPEYKVRQVKEKLGGLRLYIEGNPEAQEMAHAFEAKSYKVCENCGTTEGGVKNAPIYGWYLTLCDKCRETRTAEADERRKSWGVQDG